MGAGVVVSSLAVEQPVVVISIGMGVAIFLWVLGALLFFGLPDYYRQAPGAVPSFLASVFRRKIVLWFFLAIVSSTVTVMLALIRTNQTSQVIQNFFMSAPYGRNWMYLWSSQHLPPWGVAVMVVVFFVVIWAALLYALSVLSASHSWILPIFAIGLGAPRWCQLLWGTSGIGQYVVFAGSPLGSAIAGRTLWLWLGVLDAVQGVGFGMILLHTLTRFHISFTLIVAQMLGAIATICARAFAPDNTGPGPIFPNFALVYAAGLANAWFWVALIAQFVISGLAFLFFRKEQLSKP